MAHGEIPALGALENYEFKVIACYMLRYLKKKKVVSVLNGVESGKKELHRASWLQD